MCSFIALMCYNCHLAQWLQQLNKPVPKVLKIRRKFKSQIMAKGKRGLVKWDIMREAGVD